MIEMEGARERGRGREGEGEREREVDWEQLKRIHRNKADRDKVD